MLQWAKTQKYATQRLQERLDHHLLRGPTLNIRYSTLKAELMHLAASTSTRDETPIRLYDAEVRPTNYLKSLGVWIDHRLSFKRHAAYASS